MVDKERKPFAIDLKAIYQASTEEKVLGALERVAERWTEKYPNGGADINLYSEKSQDAF